mgnify:CR=1 FL=1
MKIAHFDCFSGISGNMILGALIDAGLDSNLLNSEISKLAISNARLHIEKVDRCGVAATHVTVHVHDHAVSASEEHHLATHRDHGNHRNLTELIKLIDASSLDSEIQEVSTRIFRRLAEAEAHVHGIKVDEVHLHEVGALDAVIDVVGAVSGLRSLGVDAIFSSPLYCGTGFVDCAHGRYPVPTPGVLALCSDIPLIQTQNENELVTPTGAAIITTLATFDRPPIYALNSVGYGAGSRNHPSTPNALRIRLGDANTNSEELDRDGSQLTTGALQRDEMVMIEANIDDMNPEIYGYLFDLLLERGAKDVFVTPVYMKKGRPGNLLSVLVDITDVDSAVETILLETTTIGVRFHNVERRKLPRISTTVSTPHGDVRIKACEFNGLKRFAPEYEDCVSIARSQNLPVLTVYEAAQNAVQKG